MTMVVFSSCRPTEQLQKIQTGKSSTVMCNKATHMLSERLYIWYMYVFSKSLRNHGNKVLHNLIFRSAPPPRSFQPPRNVPPSRSTQPPHRSAPPPRSTQPPHRNDPPASLTRNARPPQQPALPRRPPPPRHQRLRRQSNIFSLLPPDRGSELCFGNC